MKKTFLFILSITFAFGITSYIKNQRYAVQSENNIEWKTFVKKGGSKIVSHTTTTSEYNEAHLAASIKKISSRSPSSIKSENPFKGFMVRNNRILTGEIDQKYEDESTELAMLNEINPEWKDIMGSKLMKFQPEDTKVLVKEELPVIQIIEGKGRFLEQVIITYVSTKGGRSSFKALVDSQTGTIIQTWDKTISEKRIRTSGLSLPVGNESGVIAR